MTQTADRPDVETATSGSLARTHAGLGDALKEALDGSYHELREQGRRALTADDLLRPADLTMAEARVWTKDALVRLAGKGVGNAGYPVNGQSGDPAAAVTSFETVAHGDLSLTIKAGVQFGLFGGAVAGLGTKEQVDRWLPDIIATKHLGAFAMTEMGHGSDVQNLETTITYDPETDELVIDSPTPSATKTYLGNAAVHGTSATVFGQLWVDGTCYGVHCVLVPIRETEVPEGAEQAPDLPGVTTGDNGYKGGLLGVDNGTIRFDHVRVPRENLLARYGGVTADGTYSSPIESSNRRFFTTLGTLVRGRVCVGAGAAIAARRGLSIATRYALQRRQFPGGPDGGEILLLDYQSHQRKLLPAIATSYAFGFAHNELLDLLVTCQTTEVSEELQRSLESRAAGLKAAESRFANDVLQVCREACGGAGFMGQNYLTLLRQDADIFATFEGDNTVLMQLVAKGLLSGYKEQWTGLDRRETFTKTADMVGRVLLERTAGRGLVDDLVAAAQRKRGEAPMLDRGWHLQMFTERDDHVLESLAARFRAASKAPAEEKFAAVNALQNHMLTAAKAHTDRLMLEAFVAGIDACTDENAKAVLNKLCDLYALSTLEADRGWFTDHGRMSQGRSKSLTRMVENICLELRPHALALVEGLGVPVEWLGSAMLTPGWDEPQAV